MKSKRAVFTPLALLLAVLCFASCSTVFNPAEPLRSRRLSEASDRSREDESSHPAKSDESSRRAKSDESSKAPKTTSAPLKESLNPNVKTTFFDNAVFVGDSVTLGLKNIATLQRNAGKPYLGKAKFLCSGSLSYSNSAWDLDNPRSVHPKLNGKKVRVEDGVKALGAKKVFIMLGMNDFAAYDYDFIIKRATALIKKIIEKSPGVKIYVESVTPITADKQHGKFSNKNVDAFNARLKTMCQSNGWTYVNVNSQMKDEYGNLHPSYCGDPEGMGIHMSQRGCNKWVDYLIKTFAT